jgi:DNA-binding NtrC family response regulator
MTKILIADDERAICLAFSQLLKRDGYEPLIASGGREALELVEREKPAAVFLDVNMPDLSGLDALAQIRARDPQLPVIVMTAYGTMQSAMEAMRLGAFDYLGKPLELSQIRTLLQRALSSRAESAAGIPAEASLDTNGKGVMIGQSKAMQEIFKLMSLLTTNDLTILVTGESGVGKELVARGIHFNSPRREHPFVAVNCAALPENIVESELFGHERGAFTGAEARRIGRFEAAGEGTLFLDEIGELPLQLQGKLLRVLQERNFERVGSVASIPFKARLIAATNRNLDVETAAGRFREDLYFRLKLITVEIPPLRTRREDIALLARHFLGQANNELGRQITGIEADAMKAIQAHDWPGNVRELEHTIKRAVLLCRGNSLSLHELGIKPKARTDGHSLDSTDLDDLLDAARRALRDAINVDGPKDSTLGVFYTVIEAVERAIIDEALQITKGNQVAASELLGLHRTTLRKKYFPS